MNILITEMKAATNRKFQVTLHWQKNKIYNNNNKNKKYTNFGNILQ